MTAVLDALAPVLAQPRRATLAEPEPAANNRVVIPGLSWQAYQLIGEALRDRSAIRITFDRGRMEIMTISFEHELIRKWFGKLVEVLAEEFEWPTVSAGSMTFQQAAIERGFEPDDCFWVAHEPQMRGRSDYEPTRDPPPDLTLEVEITRSALDRMTIFAAFRVPEVWRYDGQSIHVHRLQQDATYIEVPASSTFPTIRVAEIAAFLRPDPSRNNLEALRDFRAWVRGQIPKK